jgi:hypothetical protein
VYPEFTSDYETDEDKNQRSRIRIQSEDTLSGWLSWLRDHIGLNASVVPRKVPRVLGGHFKPEVVDCVSTQVMSSLTLASPLAIH